MAIFTDNPAKGDNPVEGWTILADDDPRFAAIAKPFGGAAILRAKMARGSRASARMRQEWRTLLAHYPNQWAAMGENGLAGAANSHEALLELLNDRGIPIGDVATRFLNTKPGMLIL